MDDKAILISGATGSLGLALAKYITDNYNPQTIRMMSRSEYRQHLAKEKFDHEKLNWIIGDIQDVGRVMMATRGIDIVINAAAMKRVEIAEKNPLECVKVNISGVANIISGCIVHNVEKCFHISTDKAVYPITLYGKSKAVAEDLIIDANQYSKSATPMFSVGRFGNFTGSNGSASEIFEKQKAEGKPLTVTHKDMKRYFITPEDAAKNICEWINIMEGGEIFIPRMEEKHIMTIAKSISDNIEIVGIRGYEKIEEVLFMEEERPKLKMMKDYYVIK